ncbi:MAG: hypothetical protein FD143_491 [Ignavibacteria bacterium]|nr:MAG: hypothetical protein FD143_491 [Ignavibacteria bacterium]KAF0161562.1 MAG: hypothetical protein FD188_679 [Ignavibacteria bacterium]
MKTLKMALALVLLSFTTLMAQFSLETFLSDPFDQTITNIKEKHADKTIEEKEMMNFKVLMYYEWLEPISIKVGYMFTEEGKQKGKTLVNGKDEDAQKLFGMTKALLLKKYGNKYSENSMLGVTMIMFKSEEGYSIMLTQKGEKTSLVVVSK